ncbi:DNA repair protein complementing XP-A cells-like protein [Dinothrombium tinctorium]|uniref:DNA repair protein complementing XP-A cells-like protein n=1 Tax=Dinothrombium tinctorium TaxID=1965070 RepID=A0A3S3PH91_9ACAR|nr:DNA repair protein complementing XP-A cells-like protein [Dinothrombium tinctorium]RWS12377.1 DNA repair protein complementing XP-A cells-like protein [Dinothrombium tinctorium]
MSAEKAKPTSGIESHAFFSKRHLGWKQLIYQKVAFIFLIFITFFLHFSLVFHSFTSPLFDRCIDVSTLAAMPRLPNELRELVIRMHNEGFGYKLIAREFEVSIKTVRNTIKKYEETGSVEDRPKPGRPRFSFTKANQSAKSLQSSEKSSSESNPESDTKDQNSDNNNQMQQSKQKALPSRQKKSVRIAAKASNTEENGEEDISSTEENDDEDECSAEDDDGEDTCSAETESIPEESINEIFENESSPLHTSRSPVAINSGNLQCKECSKKFRHSFLKKIFNVNVCTECAQNNIKYSLMTREEAKKEFYLRDSDLDLQSPKLKSVTLYLRDDIEERAKHVWRKKKRIEHDYAKQMT